MAKKSSRSRRKAPARPRPGAFVRKWLLRIIGGIMFAILALVALPIFVNPPAGPYMRAESHRLDGIARQWVPLEQIAPAMARSAVAAEDAGFCQHWGLELEAIQAALEDGAQRGGSTISQQTVKNVYLWQGRSWTRKAIEALLTPMVEAFWSKRRILEVYLNVAEFDEGVFGVEAAALHYFRRSAADLTPEQAARLATVLPAPKSRNAADLPPNLLRKMRAVMDGAATIDRDGRADCFQD